MFLYENGNIIQIGNFSKFYFVTIYVFDATDKYYFDLYVDLKACDVDD